MAATSKTSKQTKELQAFARISEVYGDTGSLTGTYLYFLRIKRGLTRLAAYEEILASSSPSSDKLSSLDKIYQEYLVQESHIVTTQQLPPIIRSVKDLRCGDLVELYSDANFRTTLTDEFDINIRDNSFVADEDDSIYTYFSSISKLWREDEKRDYVLIYEKPKGE